MRKVLEGGRLRIPERADGAWFTDDLWSTLNLCWKIRPENRPSIEAVLERLEQLSRTWNPPSPQTDEDAEKDDDSDWDLTAEMVRPVWFLVSTPFPLTPVEDFVLIVSLTFRQNAHRLTSNRKL